MPGAGTGYPLTLRCAKCKRHRDYKDIKQSHRGCNLVRTGRTRAKTGRGGYYHGFLREFVQYRCLDCGHVGWTRHSDILHKRLEA